MSTRAPAGMPVYRTAFVGRRTELAALRQLLAGSAHLITVIGVGGTGKTRIVAELASKSTTDATSLFPDGVTWVDLAPIADPDLVVAAAALALGVPAGPTGDLLPALIRAVGERRVLLILDNCEELAQACRDLADALAACPQLVVVATSRTALGTQLEQVVVLPPMSAATGGELSEAAELFYDRASLVLPAYPHQAGDLPVVNRLCVRLDGLPLAIELAAPWIRTLSARDLMIEIERSADLLATTNPTLTGRHRSMRAVWDSTWRSLAADEQRVLSRLSVFRGGFTREAGEAVAGANPAVLGALSERALIRPPAESDDRYGLHELVREYAADMFRAEDPDAVDDVRQAHLDYFLPLFESVLQAIDTPDEYPAFARLLGDLPNAEVALGYALDSGLVESALRLTAALTTLDGGLTGWGPRVPRFHTVLALPWDHDSIASAAARARILNATGYATMQADARSALRYFEETADLYERAGNTTEQARALSSCGFAVRVEDPGAAVGYIRHGLAICERTGDSFGAAWLRLDLGEALFVAGRDAEAETLVLDSMRQLDLLGVPDGSHVGWVILGHAYRRQRRWREAIEAYLEAIRWQQEHLDVLHGGDVLTSLAVVALALDRDDCAGWLFGADRAWRTRQPIRSLLDPRRELDIARAAAEQRLTDPDWASRYRSGQLLTREEALARASSDARELLVACAAARPLGLTDRQLQVIRLVAEGLSDADVATKLGISRRTVHTQLRSVYAKTKVTSRTAAVHELKQLGLLDTS